MGFLTLITFIPLVGAAIITFLPKGKIALIKKVAVAATGLTLLLTIVMLLRFDRTMPGINKEGQFQFVEHYKWIDVFNIDYFMGVDGLSFPMILLTSLLCFLCIFASWNIDRAQKGYFALFLNKFPRMVNSTPEIRLCLS